MKVTRSDGKAQMSWTDENGEHTVKVVVKSDDQ